MRVLSFLLRLYCSTWKVSRRENYFSNVNRGAIVASWHSDILSLLWINRQESIAPIVSLSRDGERLCDLLRHWGYRKFIRGSSSRKGKEVLLESQEAVRSGWEVAFALDGPRGPRQEAKPGALIVSIRTGRPIVLLTARASRAYTFSSWDRFCLPMPFARIELNSLLWMPENEISIEEAKRQLSEKMWTLRNQNHLSGDSILP